MAARLPELALSEIFDGLVAADSIILKALNADPLSEVQALERRLFQALGTSWMRRARSALAKADKTLAQSDQQEKYSDNIINPLLKRIQQAFNGWDEEMSPLVKTTTREAYMIGQRAIFDKARGRARGRLVSESPHLTEIKKAPAPRTAVAVQPQFGLVDQKAVDVLAGRTTFWIGRHYDSNLSRRIAAIARAQLITSGLGPQEAAQSFHDAMVAEFGLDPKAPFVRGAGIEIPRGWKGTALQYFEGLATNTATVARVSGSLREMDALNVTKYQVVNPIDERTCDRCSFMDGKSFTVKEAYSRWEKELGAADPMAVRDIHPWASDGPALRAAAAGSGGLMGAGMAFPPFHYRCRCTVDIASDAEFELPAAGPTEAPSEETTAPNEREALRTLPVSDSKKLDPNKSGMNESIIFYLQKPDGSTIRAIFKSARGESPGLRPGIDVGTYYKREVAASKLDEALGLGLTPTTEIREAYGGELGSIQLFAEDTTSLSGIGKLLRSGAEIDRAASERLLVFDYIIGNSDRHGGNILFKKVKGKIVPVAIDHGLAFSRRAPARFIFPTQLLEPGMLAETREFIARIDPRVVAKVLAEAGLEREAIRLTLRRVEFLKQNPSYLEMRRGQDPYRFLQGIEDDLLSPRSGQALPQDDLQKIDDIVDQALAEAPIEPQ